MNETLNMRLHRIAGRFRSYRFFRSWTIAATLLFAFVVVLIFNRQELTTDGQAIAIGVAALSLLVMCFLAVWSMLSFRDVKWVAMSIEQRYPSLNQRLLTAIDQREDELGYLQQRVIKEARDHSRQNPWQEVVSSVWLFFSGIGGIVITGALVLGIFILANPLPQSSAIALAINSQSGLSITVSPQDIEVERGTGVAITADFGVAFDPSGLPDRAKVLATRDDESTARLVMTQNLSDPIVAVAIPEVLESFDYLVRIPGWQSDTYRITAFDYPALLRSDALITYPSYTNLAEKTIEDTVRVSAVVGSKVTWKCFLNKSVAKAELVPKGSQSPLAMTVSEENIASLNLSVLQTTQYELNLTDHQGRKNKLPIVLKVKAIKNSPAKIRITTEGDREVSAIEEMTLAATIVDDFGLLQSGIGYSVDGETPTEQVLSKQENRDRRASVETLIELEALSAEPDQLLTYYFWADDHGPAGEVRRVQSDVFFAEIRPFDQVFRKGDPPPPREGGPPSKQEEASELAELQKEIISATWKLRRRSTQLVTSDADADSSTSLATENSQFQTDVAVVKDSQRNAIEKLKELSQELSDEKSQQRAAEALIAMENAASKLELASRQDSTRSDISISDLLSEAMRSEQAAYSGLLKLRTREFEITKQQRSQSSASASASQRKRQKQLNELEIDEDEDRYETRQQAQETKQESAERAARQVTSRLKELARRQQDLNEAMVDLQTALQLAETEQEKTELNRRLQRLREQQQELLRDTDELAERMQESPSEEASEDLDSLEQQEQNQQKLSQARDDVRRASEAMQSGDPSAALAAGSRAQQQLKDLQEEFRQQNSSQFEQAMKQLGDQAAQLKKRQEEIAANLNREEQAPSAGLRGDENREDLAASLGEQAEDMRELLSDLQDTVEAADEAEPLLAEQLFDAFLEAEKSNIDGRLEQAAQLHKLGFEPQTKQAEQIAREGIDELQQAIEQSASSVLGDSTRALQRALSELDQLQSAMDTQQSQLSSENPAQTQRDDAASQTDRDRNRQAQSDQSSPNEESSRLNQPQTRSDSEGQPNDNAQPNPQTRSEPQDGLAPPSENGKPTSRSPGSSSSALNQFAGQAESSGGGAGPAAAPITGEGFRDFTDRLRDVEEMVDQADIRSRSAQIRDRMREMRIDFRRHSKTPSRELVDEMIVLPLKELRRDVQEELLRQSAEKNAIVPIDRDPVPQAFEKAQQLYYERLSTAFAAEEQESSP